jgi:hypothetical protein
VLQITSWRGIAIDGQHYYGTLFLEGGEGHNEYKVSRRLTRRTAAILNKERKLGPRDMGLFKVGDETTCFESPAHVRRTALRHWQRLFPGALVLLEGRFALATPQHCIAGEAAIRARINDYYRRAEATGGYEGNFEAMRAIDDEYWEWVCAYGSEGDQGEKTWSRSE